MNDPYIYVRNNSLPKPFCNEVIDFFEKNKHMHKDGLTIGGINKNVKDTSDIFINMGAKKNYPENMMNIIKLIQDEIRYNLTEYYKCINNVYKNEDEKIIKNPLSTEGFLIQKYEKGIGNYKYHNDGYITETGKDRRITFLFYLNDVDIGGETEFMNTYKIQPRQGTILLFPSTWTYHHRGNIPISGPKYIITGWLST